MRKLLFTVLVPFLALPSGLAQTPDEAI